MSDVCLASIGLEFPDPVCNKSTNQELSWKTFTPGAVITELAYILYKADCYPYNGSGTVLGAPESKAPFSRIKTSTKGPIECFR